MKEQKRGGGYGSFWLVYSVALLAAVLMGFGPTFFLRPLFHEEPLPVVLVVHGVVSTLWFLLLVRQAWLIRARRPEEHMRVGQLGWVVIAVLFLAGVPTAFGLTPRLVAAGVADPSTVDTVERWAQVARDGLLFVLFVGIAIAALVVRRRSDAHKRLILLASVVLTTPGLARLTLLDALRWVPEPIGFLGLLLALLVIPIVHDRITEGSVHPTLKWGAPATFLLVLLLLLLPELV